MVRYKTPLTIFPVQTPDSTFLQLVDIIKNVDSMSECKNGVTLV